jgi:hypothetical protein
MADHRPVSNDSGWPVQSELKAIVLERVLRPQDGRKH